MRVIKAVLALLLAAAAAIVVARQLFPLPSIEGRPAEAALPAVTDGVLGRMAGEGSSANPGKSGVVPIAGGHDAIASRLVLSAAATHSIDAQYYIWHDDTSGRLLLRALYEASKRGVRVRLLLDDNGVPGLDRTMATLAAQPNFEVRLFNPSTVRRPKMLGYTFDFFRMNRRMHNKSFIVDGVAAIVGGRNVGNEYFKVGDESYYFDLDVLGTGPVVQDTSAAFDRYWNSASVFAADSILDMSAANLETFLAETDEAAARPEAAEFITPDALIYKRLRSGALGLEWVDVKLVVDDPSKGEGKATKDQLMIAQLAKVIGPVSKGLDLVSAYFVPGKAGTDYFDGLARAGAQVRILTNALETTDVAMVHAGYAKYRRGLLEGGVKLYELRPVEGAPDGDAELNVIGSSGASLHAKTFSVDGDRIFIGSFNFDPRSALLNCEMGFLIDSPAMAQTISGAFDNRIPEDAYTVSLTPGGELSWTASRPGEAPQSFSSDPHSGVVKRALVVVLGWLPIEWML